MTMKEYIKSILVAIEKRPSVGMWLILCITMFAIFLMFAVTLPNVPDQTQKCLLLISEPIIFFFSAASYVRAAEIYETVRIDDYGQYAAKYDEYHPDWGSK